MAELTDAHRVAMRNYVPEVKDRVAKDKFSQPKMVRVKKRMDARLFEKELEGIGRKLAGWD